MISLRHLRPGLAATLLVWGALLSGGCGGQGSRFAVDGTVTLNGQPVDGGLIMFFPIEETAAEGEKRAKAHGEIQNGKYKIESSKGPNAGNYRVEVIWNKKTGKQISPDPPNVIDETIQVVPLTYNANSTLKVEVKSGQTTFNFDLKGSPPSKSGESKKKGD